MQHTHLDKQNYLLFYKFALKLCKNPETAYDLIHESYLKTEHISFDTKSHFNKYMITSIKTILFDSIKDKKIALNNKKSVLLKNHIKPNYIQWLEQSIDLLKISKKFTPKQHEVINAQFEIPENEKGSSPYKETSLSQRNFNHYKAEVKQIFKKRYFK